MRAAAFVFFCVHTAFAGTTFQATTTLAAETSNNTSAAAGFTAQSNGNAGAGNVSKASLRTLLYPGSTAKIYGHFVPWFGFGDHMNVGYTSNDATQVQKQVADMASRGLDGAMIDWYGQGTMNHNFVLYDQATQEFMQAAEQAAFSFAIMDDAGSLKVCAATSGCDITQTLINDLNYAFNTYENSSAYLRVNGQPVVYFFGHEAYAIDWSRVRASVSGNPMFIFRNTPGFQSAQSNGAFSWVAPETVTSSDPMALNYLASFDNLALSLLPTYSTESAYKGFNDSLAAWGTNRLIGQQCGQTWLQSIAEADKFYSASRQMTGIQLVTWNDYEEGTEFESGIDNCVTVAASTQGGVVSWNITGQVNTIDHFTVFVSQDGQNLMPLADLPPGTLSLDLAPFALTPGTYTVYVKAVGKPSITNKMSGAAQIIVPGAKPQVVLNVSPGSGFAPVTVNASTTGSSSANGSIASSMIDFGDGSAVVSGAGTTHVYSSAGTYTVTAKVTDSLGVSSTSATTVVVQAPQVVVSSPAAGTASGPAVHVVASGFSGFPVTAMQIYVDGSLVFTVNSANLDTSITLAPGTHQLVIKGWDSSGRNFPQTLVITIPEPPPVAMVSTTASTLLEGATLSVSTAGSSAPGGTIARTVIAFGDGSPSVSAAGASHVYGAAGTYAVSATVTNNLGVSSTAATQVTVIPPEVVVTSPTSGSIVHSPVRVEATSLSGFPVTAMQVYLDGKLTVNLNTAHLNTLLAMAPGRHAMVVKGWNSMGQSFMKQLSLSVQ